MPDVVPYPPELVGEYRRDGLWGERTIAQELHATAEQHPDAPAVLTAAEELTYAELDRRTDHVAVGLRDLGLEPGERVLLQITNSLWAVLAWYGLIKAGLVPVATLAQHRQHEISDIARQCEAAAHLVQADFPGHDLVAFGRTIADDQPSLRTLLTVHADEPPQGAVALESLVEAGGSDAEARAAVEEIQRGVDPDQLAAMQLSGGTTDIPKLIPRLHAEYWLNARAYAAGMQLESDGCVVHLLPVVHNAGIVCALHAAHSVGACFSMSPPDAEELTALARSGRLTHIMMPPPVAQMIQGNPDLREAMRSLRVVIWVLGKLPDQIVEEFETAECTVGQMFGQSEGLCMITPLDASAEIRHNTVGAPLCEVDEVRLYAPGTEDEVAEGKRGELCCRGPYTLRGYYRAPERNAEAFTSDGFYRTGDLVVEVKEDGRSFYSLEDRIKDLINRGGEKVNAVEVEKLLVRHAAIEEAALVAMPDERLGERACAYVVLAPDADAPTMDEMQAFLDDIGVAKFKWPERIQERDELPRTNIDKIDKATLREEIAGILEAES